MRRRWSYRQLQADFSKMSPWKKLVVWGTALGLVVGVISLLISAFGRPLTIIVPGDVDQTRRNLRAAAAMERDRLDALYPYGWQYFFAERSGAIVQSNPGKGKFEIALDEVWLEAGDLHIAVDSIRAPTGHSIESFQLVLKDLGVGGCYGFGIGVDETNSSKVCGELVESAADGNVFIIGLAWRPAQGAR